AAAVLDASLFQVDIASSPARVTLKSPAVIANTRKLNAVAIAFTAGYGDAASDVPQAIRTAILEMIAELYTNRGYLESDPPAIAQAMLAPYRVLKLGSAASISAPPSLRKLPSPMAAAASRTAGAQSPPPGFASNPEAAPMCSARIATNSKC